MRIGLGTKNSVVGAGSGCRAGAMVVISSHREQNHEAWNCPQRNMSPDKHIFKVGLNYKFGWGKGPVVVKY